MTDKTTQAMAAQGNTEKDPDDWVTGDEPMTGAQRSYLKTLCEETRQEFDGSLSKAEASRRIDQLQEMAGRGGSASPKASDPGAGGHSSDEHVATTPDGRERTGTGIFTVLAEQTGAMTPDASLSDELRAFANGIVEMCARIADQDGGGAGQRIRDRFRG